MDIGMGILWGGLLAAPVLAFVFLGFWRRRRDKVIVAALLVLMAIVVPACFGLRFTSSTINIAALMLAYAAYCLLVRGGWGMDAGPARFLASALTIIPIAAGYLAATIGLLGLLFAFNGYTGKSGHSETLAPGIGCEVRLVSGGPSWGTTNVSIHRELTPFLRWEAWHQKHPENNGHTSSTLCRNAYAEWRSR